ncbi:MAG: hypothetical protein ABIJ30_07310 [bacterium]
MSEPTRKDLEEGMRRFRKESEKKKEDGNKKGFMTGLTPEKPKREESSFGKGCLIIFLLLLCTPILFLLLYHLIVSYSIQTLIICLILFAISLLSFKKGSPIKLARKYAIGLLILSSLFGFFAIVGFGETGGLINQIKEKRAEKVKAEATRKQQDAIRQAYSFIKIDDLVEAETKFQEAIKLVKETGVKPDSIGKGLRIVRLIEGGEEAKKIAQETLKQMILDELSSLKKDKSIPPKFQLNNKNAEESLVALLYPLVDNEIKQREEQAKKLAEKSKAEELAEKRRIEAEKRHLALALRKMRKEYDKIEEITWYYDKTTPRYDNRNNLHLFIGKTKDSLPWLYFRIRYSGDDWLFIEKYIIKVDDEKFEIIPSYGEVKRDNSAGKIWEWYTCAFRDKEHIVRAIISSKRAVIRYKGSQYYKDRTVTKAEKIALQNVLDAYKALGGKEE